MILAGIDEVGYGCVLGPLVVGACAIELPDDTPIRRNALCPDAWALLRRSVSPRKAAGRLHVADSKLVYKPGIGLAALEASVLCLCRAAGVSTDSLDSILQAVLHRGGADIAASAWYGGRGIGTDQHPHAVDATSLAPNANALLDDCNRAGVRFAHLSATVVTERRFNRLCEKTHNKATTLFSLSVEHLDKLVRQFHGQGLTVICDRQGGRRHYGALLRTMFEGFKHTIVQESESIAIYEIAQHGAVSRIVFSEKAEAVCLPTAAASMLGKYLRERLMHRFNTYWRTHVPTLSPTAGYWTDGLRFLQDIAGVRAELGVSDAVLVRSR